MSNHVKTSPLKSKRRSVCLAGCLIGVFALTSAVQSQPAVRGPVQLSTIQGITKIQNQDVVVTVVFAVPPGESARANGRRALQSIQPGAQEIDQSTFVLTGSVWDQFGDGVAGNDFVEVNFNDAGVPNYLDRNGAFQAFLNSMATWNDVSSSTFVFKMGEMTSRCPSLVNECKGGQFFDGLNDVTWLNIRERNVLGVTWSGTTIDEFDMAIDNQDFTWFIGDENSVPSNEIDLQTVVTHEFGHAAGIGHSEIDGAVMEAYYGGPRRALSPDDVAALTFLYPSSGGGTDPGPDPEPEPETDVEAPVISNLSAVKLHRNGRFEITWQTDEAADTVIEFTSPVNDTFSDGTLETNHRMVFRGTPGVDYVFVVKSTDASGNTSEEIGSHQN